MPIFLLSPGYLWAAFHFWQTSRIIEADIAAADSFDGKVPSTKVPSTTNDGLKVELRDERSPVEHGMIDSAN